MKKIPHFLRRIGLRTEDFEFVDNAIHEAEKTTDGEIVTAVIKESDDYSFFEFFFAFSLGLFAFTLLLVFYHPVEQLIAAAVWYPAVWYQPALMGLVMVTVTGVSFFIANIPAIDRLIIPQTVRNRRVFERAVRYFAESGAYKTREHIGIVIFISVLEHRVVVLADDGIAEKISNDDWCGVCDMVIEGIKTKKIGRALCDAVARCGTILAQHFPVTDIQKNELSNGLVVLDTVGDTMHFGKNGEVSE